MKTLDNRFGTIKMATTQVIDRIPLSCDIRLRSEILHYKENLVLTFFLNQNLLIEQSMPPVRYGVIKLLRRF